MSDDSATAIKCPLCAVTVPADKVDLPNRCLHPPVLCTGIKANGYGPATRRSTATTSVRQSRCRVTQFAPLSGAAG